MALFIFWAWIVIEHSTILPTTVDVSIVNETSPEANWNSRTDGQANLFVLGGCASKNIEMSKMFKIIEMVKNMKIVDFVNIGINGNKGAIVSCHKVDIKATWRTWFIWSTWSK